MLNFFAGVAVGAMFAPFWMMVGRYVKNIAMNFMSKELEDDKKEEDKK